MKEKFLRIPFLPSNKVSLVALDGRCNGSLEEYPNLVGKLAQLQIRVLEVPICPDLYGAIAAHPDIQFHPVGGDTIVIAPNAGKGLAEKFLAEGFTLIEGKKVLEDRYPLNVAYNVARLGKWAFHNTEATDPVLREQLEKRGVEFVHIQQGYSKCATLILGDKMLISEDKGLSEKAEDKEIRSLVIPTGFIRLPGLNYGFLGGAGGLIDKNKIAIAGDITLSPCQLNIINYLEQYSINLETLSNQVILDIGSIIPLKELA